jgi:hypothetical protein
MKTDDVQPVIDKYLEDRSGLTEDEMGLLINALQVDRKLAGEVKEQLLLDEMLRQKLVADRRHFSAQVDQRLRDYESGEILFESKTIELQEQVERALIGNFDEPAPAVQVSRRKRRRRRSSRLWLVAVVLLVGVTVAGAMIGWNNWQNGAVIGKVEGEVVLIRDGQQQTLAAMAEVRDGDQFETSASGKLTLRYRDGTTVELNGKTKAKFRTGWSKEMTISKGHISADVTPQQFAATMKFRTPAADAHVLGTKLRITAREGGTRLDVTEGSVKLARTSDDNSVLVAAGHYGIATNDDLYVTEMRWPSSREGLVFHTTSPDKQRLHLASPSGTRLFYALRPEGNARIDDQLKMILDGGHVRPAFANDAADDLLQACQLSGELTIECVLHTEYLQQDGPARIATFSTDSSNYNFSLGQQDDRLVLRLLTTGGSEQPNQSEISLCHLADAAPHHLVVTYRDGLTMCFLDGEKVCENNSVAGDFLNWQPQHLLLGNERSGGRPWKGELRGLAIYNRTLSQDEARENRKRLQQIGVVD